MSIAEIERLAADLQSNEALRAESEKHAAERPQETPIARAVSFARSKGYAFTVDEAREYIKAKAKAAGTELSDADLDGVAGGNGDPTSVPDNLHPTWNPGGKYIAFWSNRRPGDT